ncbi:MAG: DEAD/DEAH box helicase, partial [Polyangiaceae bacterium]
LFNWAAEAARFAPELAVGTYHGPARHRVAFDTHDLVLTTYGTLRRDRARLKEQRFDYVILDEAQAIKNPRSIAAKACRELSCDHRLALSGTPIENHLGDLASLFDFLNPGMSRCVRAMRALGTTLAPDPEQRRTLATALRPFVLRRTKDEVLDDLPSKTEQILHCELSTRQRREYDELAVHYRAHLKKKIERDGFARSRFNVLEALLRLRQAACHPGLVHEARRDEDSAKGNRLLSHLDELVAAGHKALVFSQFTTLLRIVAKRLDERGHDHAYLDGKTRDRAAAVERFQTDPTCGVFLLSLKAGNAGLNLTAADYVFLLDPWWNPAVEAQAIDRAHRIGQTRPVVAYRLVAKDTVEDSVVALSSQKRELARDVLDRGWARAYPAGHAGHGDIDPVPIVFGAGLS